VRVCLLAPAIAVCSFGLAPMPALAAPSCGHANLHNPGHHYGLYKNGCIPLPPAPKPPPVKPPVPGHHPPPNSPPIGNSPALKLTQAAAAGLGFQPFFTVPGGVELGTQGPDRNLWVIEALLPVLLVIWLMLVAGARSFRMRPAQELAAA
jgi:hypothetical protein